MITSITYDRTNTESDEVVEDSNIVPFAIILVILFIIMCGFALPFDFSVLFSLPRNPQ